MHVLNKLFSWYFKRGSLPYWLLLIVDLLTVYVASIFTYWVINRGHALQIHFYDITNAMWIYMLICIVAYKLFSTYSGIIRYSSFVDLRRVAYANIAALLLSVGANYLLRMADFSHIEQFMIRHLFIMFVIAIALQWGIRILVKIVYDVVSNKELSQNVFIYGIHDGGVGLAKAIRSQRPLKYVLRGFISPYAKESGFLLLGVRVYYDLEKLKTAMKKCGVEAVLVSPTRHKEFRDNEELQDLLITMGIKILMIEQRIKEDGEEDDDNNDMTRLKEVGVEDLLPRDEIQVDLASVRDSLSGKRILITGAAGSIGSEIVRQVASFAPAAMMLIDQAETPEHDIRLMMAKRWPSIKADTIVTSICNEKHMEWIFSDFKPDYVFHAAAYKHVPMMENNPGMAVYNNVYGTKVIADLSVKYGVKKFVMISTDKAVNPTNVMGCSKRICEIYVQSLSTHLRKQGKTGATEFITTRFGNVLGSNGSVIPLFREQIRNGGPVTVTDPNIIRFFMLIPEACKLVLEAGTKGNGGEIFVFDMGKPVRITDLAKRMIRLSGATNVEIKYTGLRQGEKLYEEVLNDNENTKPTFHEKIRIAAVREYDFDNVSKEIDNLITLAKQYDPMATVKKMKEIVPEFKSNNSVYESLDNKGGVKNEK